MSEANAVTINRTKKWRWWVACVVVGLGAYYWWSTDSADVASNARGMGWNTKVPVRTVSVQEGSIDHSLTAIGTVIPLNTVAVRSQVDGELIKVLFRDGQHVSEGDLLALIDPRTYQVQRDQAQAKLLQTQAELKGAQAELQRHKVLFQQNSISRQALETKETAVQQLSAQVKAAQADVASAQVQVDRTRIVSPLTGRLGLRRLDQGNLISAANTDGLVTISQLAPISVEFSLPQTQLGLLSHRLRTDDAPVSVMLTDQRGNDLGVMGKVVALDNQINVATGSLRIKAEFLNEDEALFPNQFVNVRALLGVEQGLLIPSYAVQRGSVGTFVYIVNDEDKVRVQPVTLGISNSDFTQITEGVSAGERIVVEGVDRLREGSAVEIVEHDGQVQEPKESTAPSGGEKPGPKGAGRGPRTGP